MRASSGAATQIAAAAAAPTAATGSSAISKSLRTWSRPPTARARDIQRIRPVSAPSSRVFDAIVNSAMSSNSAPAPAGCSQRLTSTVRPKVSAAPLTMATRLISDPRAITAVSGETADGCPGGSRRTGPESSGARLRRAGDAAAAPGRSGRPGRGRAAGCQQ